MGLFDIFRSPGALSQQQSMELSQQGAMHPQYDAMMQQATDPRNMNTGQKLMMLGSALQGKNVSQDINDYKQGIRDRFKSRYDMQRQAQLDKLNQQQTRLGMAQTQLNMANTTQNMAIADEKLPGQLTAQQLQNTGTQLANEGSVLSNQGLNLSNEGQILANQKTQQAINQGNAVQIEYVGNATDGRLIQTDAMGNKTDVTNTVPASVLNAYKAKETVGVTTAKNYNPSLGRTLTTAEVKSDEAFGKEFGTNSNASAAANIATLDTIADQLSLPGADATGLSWFSPVKSLSRVLDPDGSNMIRTLFDQDGLDTQEIVAGIIQKNLRETLGAQFTQKEGQLLIQRAYNPALSTAQNAARLKAISALATAVLREKQARSDYYSQNGTIAGYVPKTTDAMLDEMRAQTKQIYIENGGYGNETSAAPAQLSPEGQAVFEKYKTVN